MKVQWNALLQGQIERWQLEQGGYHGRFRKFLRSEEGAMIQPTVGRVVWFRPEGPSGPTLTALICGVNDERSINIALFDTYGNHLGGRTNVFLFQGENANPRLMGPYCEWMPYQKGQAAKTGWSHVQSMAAKWQVYEAGFPEREAGPRGAEPL